MALVLATGCRAGRESAVPASRPSIVLITIDTFRANRIGRGFTPAVDALASAGVRFDSARSAVPLTLPSHVTIMTGVLPLAHGVRANGVVFAPQPSAPPLARVLKGAGYQTGALRLVERSRRAEERCRSTRRCRAGHDGAHDGNRGPAAPAAMAPEASERLRALGHVSGSAAPAGGDPRASNPARVIDAWAPARFTRERPTDCSNC